MSEGDSARLRHAGPHRSRGTATCGTRRGDNCQWSVVSGELRVAGCESVRRWSPSRLAGTVGALDLDAVLVGVEDEEAVYAADFVFEVPGDGVAGGGIFFGGGVDVGDPKAEVAGAGRFGGADDEMEIDVTDAIPATGEV